MAKTTTNYSLTLPTKLGRRVQKKARKLYGKRGFSRAIRTALEGWVNLP